MSQPQGSCAENCPIVGILQGEPEAYRQANMHDGLLAEELSHVPNATEVLMADCPLGGPHRRRFSLAKLACSSQVAESHTQPQEVDLIAETEAAILHSTSIGNQI